VLVSVMQTGFIPSGQALRQALTLAVGLASSGHAESPATEERFTATSTEDRQLSFLQYLPASYDEDSDKRWPLVIFLHGAGERRDNLKAVKAHGPPKAAGSSPSSSWHRSAPRTVGDRGNRSCRSSSNWRKLFASTPTGSV
jgi:predicted peptidase